MNDKKIAAQFAVKAQRKAVTDKLRDAFGATVSRKQLKEFEKTNETVQWFARREEPAQTFRTPLGFVRPAGARGVYEIPAACAVDFITDAVAAGAVDGSGPIEPLIELTVTREDPPSDENAAVAAGKYGLTQV